MTEFNDNASASMSGYIFQIEKALLILPDLALDEYVSIEQVDDVAKHDSDGTVLLTIQAKHSISKSGTTFQDTSLSLWRTLEIWITKLRDGILNSETTFCCSSNKDIPTTSLLNKFLSKSLDEVIDTIKLLLEKEQKKLANAKRGGNHLKKIIELIEYTLANKALLKIIIENLKIETDNTPKEDFINKIHLNGRQTSQRQKDTCYDTFVGWIVNSCKAKWKNSEDAKFTKQDFDTKYQMIMSNSSIINAIFRDKKELSSMDISFSDNYSDALFVTQIQDLVWNKQARERAVSDAVIDYIYSEIELKNIVDIGDYTEEDFIEFTEFCQKEWQDWVDSLIVRDLEDYTEEEKNALAVTLFNKVMKEIKLTFDKNYSFTESTKYIQNGTFLKLSDEPKIGWHPEWETKYFEHNIDYGI